MLKIRQVLLELTAKRPKRKVELIMKKLTSLLKRKKVLIASIIQKINLFKRRLNFFDIMIIFLLLVVLVFFIYNRLQRNSIWTDIRISVENTDWWYEGSPPNYWYAGNLKVGDIVTNSFGNKVAEIVNIDNYDLGGPYRTIYVDLRIKTDFDKNKNQYLYEFKPLVVGSSLSLNFAKEQLKGLVVKIGNEEIKYSYKTIKVVIKNDKETEILPSLADKIHIGDKSYDTKGDLIAEIISVKSKIASYYEFSDIRGKNIEVYDPDYRDLEITLKIKSFEGLNRNFYINDAVLKIGTLVWFQFPEYALENARIIEIID